jgi:hypothetical protein
VSAYGQQQAYQRAAFERDCMAVQVGVQHKALLSLGRRNKELSDALAAAEAELAFLRGTPSTYLVEDVLAGKYRKDA